MLKSNLGVSFSKDDSLLLKGIFVLVMVYYHAVSLSSAITIPFMKEIFSNTGNVCVTIFAIISVYGLTKKCENTRPGISFFKSRIISTYQSYWPIWFIALFVLLLRQAVSFITSGSTPSIWVATYGEMPLSIFRMIANFLGLTHIIYGDNMYTMNQTWWYMSLALLIIFLTPLVKKIYDRVGVSLLLVAIGIAFVFKYVYLQYLPIIVLGVMCAEHIEKDKKPVMKKVELLISLILIIAWVLIRVMVDQPYGPLLNCLATLPLINVFKKLFALDLGIVRVTRKIMLFFGKHSANIFYCHSLLYYYWPTNRIVSIVNIGIYRFIVTVFMSVVFSIVIEFFKKKSHWNGLFNRIK